MSTLPSISDRRSFPPPGSRGAHLNTRAIQAGADDDGDNNNNNNNGMPESSNNDRRTSRSHRPLDTSFRQQRLPKWRPLMTPQFVIPCYFAVGIVFVIVGVILVLTVDKTTQITIDYGKDHPCPYYDRLAAFSYGCQPYRVPLHLNKTLEAPVFMYYQLNGFHQNNEQYLNAKSENQLGNNNPFYDMKTCMPLTHPGVLKHLNDSEVGSSYFTDAGPRVSFEEAYYWPCGIIPWSRFNDSLTIYNATSWDVAINASRDPDDMTDLTIICDAGAWDELGYQTDPTTKQYCHKRGITWDTDVGTRYKEPPDIDKALTSSGWAGACNPYHANTSSYNRYICNGWYLREEGHSIPPTVDEDLMVWLRASPSSEFRKLHRVIDVDLKPGPYVFEVLQAYDVSSFGGDKSVILMSHAIVSKNYVLAGCYLIVGTLCLVFGIAFAIMHRITG